MRTITKRIIGKFMLFPLFVIFFFSISFADSSMIINGLSYLVSTQNDDGSWGSTLSNTDILPTTVVVTETLQILNQINLVNYYNAISWLQNQSLETTD